MINPHRIATATFPALLNMNDEGLVPWLTVSLSSHMATQLLSRITDLRLRPFSNPAVSPIASLVSRTPAHWVFYPDNLKLAHSSI